jgi:hypothetical protein
MPQYVKLAFEIYLQITRLDYQIANLPDCFFYFGLGNRNVPRW